MSVQSTWYMKMLLQSKEITGFIHVLYHHYPCFFLSMSIFSPALASSHVMIAGLSGSRWSRAFRSSGCSSHLEHFGKLACAQCHHVPAPTPTHPPATTPTHPPPPHPLTPHTPHPQPTFLLSATLCHDVLCCCHAVATPDLSYSPVLTCLTSDTGKFSYVVLRNVSLPQSCSLTATTLSCAVPRKMTKYSVP